jgi:hypothetical protein
MCKFIQNDETVDIFPGQVQFYLEHTLLLTNGTRTHRFAFVKWYNWIPDEKTKFYSVCKKHVMYRYLCMSHILIFFWYVRLLFFTVRTYVFIILI